MKIPQSVREVIERGPLAHLTTLIPDGGPQVTVVWVGIEGEEFLMGHLALHQKIKNGSSAESVGKSNTHRVLCPYQGPPLGSGVD
jgi:hypothetical protein